MELRDQKLAAEVEKIQAEAELARANLAIAKEHLGITKVRRVEAERKADVENAQDERCGRYRFVSQINEANVRLCINRLTEWERLYPDRDIEITITSGGGEIVQGLALYDFLQTLKKPTRKIIIVCFGIAASMAGVILQAGDVRRMGKESWLMLHEASLAVEGKSGEIENRIEWVRAVENRLWLLYANRSNLSKAQIKNKLKGTDWFVDSTEALEKGFVDEVV